MGNFAKFTIPSESFGQVEIDYSIISGVKVKISKLFISPILCFPGMKVKFAEQKSILFLHKRLGTHANFYSFPITISNQRN